MKTEKIKNALERLESLHKEFESKFPELYTEKSLEGLHGLVKELYSIAGEKMDIAGELYRELAPVSRDTEGVIKELQKNEHQMKFRLEELMNLLAGPLDYEDKTRLKAALDRLVQFHRIYDYTMRRAIQVVGKEVESIEFMERMGLESENQKKVPAGIMERLKGIEEVERKLETLVAFTGRLYSHPGDVHKVEEALIEWHRMGLLWVEARNVEKLSGVREAGEILEGLTLIGVTERKKRGGESVYRHRSFSSG